MEKGKWVKYTIRCLVLAHLALRTMGQNLGQLWAFWQVNKLEGRSCRGGLGTHQKALGIGGSQLERVWTARRSNQAILKEISPQYSLELMLKLKLQYFGYLMRRTDSFEKTLIWERLKVGGEGDDRGWDGWMASPTWWTWVWVNSGSWWWMGRPGVLWSMGPQRVGHNWAIELNWTE